jgi:hypothetical protein
MLLKEHEELSVDCCLLPSQIPGIEDGHLKLIMKALDEDEVKHNLAITHHLVYACNPLRALHKAHNKHHLYH